MALHAIYLGNDNVIFLRGLRRAVEGTYANSGNVTVTDLIDAEGESVGPQNWPTVMLYKTNSDGEWYATLEEDLQLVAGAKYTAIIDADAGADVKGHWEIPLIAQVRSS